jgi:hypothetical protein
MDGISLAAPVVERARLWIESFTKATPMGSERVLAVVGIIGLLVMLGGLWAPIYPRPWYVKAARTGGAIVTLVALGLTVLLFILTSVRVV